MTQAVVHITASVRRVGTSDAAALSGLSVDTIRRAADAGTLPHTRTPGGHRRFLVADIEALATPVHASRRSGAEGSRS